MNNNQTIDVQITPALATPGKLMVTSVRGGFVMSTTGRFGDSPIKYFDSEQEAKDWTLALPQTMRKYRFV